MTNMLQNLALDLADTKTSEHSRLCQARIAVSQVIAAMDAKAAQAELPMEFEHQAP
jgi:hypothetical protein